MTSAIDASPPGPSPTSRLRVLVLWNREADEETAHESPAPAEPAPPAVRAVMDVLRARGFDAVDLDVEDDVDRIAAAMVIERPALIFNLVDELYGDAALLGNLAAYLELLEVPFVGAEPACLFACQDRARVRLVLGDAGVPVPRFRIVRDVDAVPAIQDLHPPLVVTQAYDDVYDDEGRERPLHHHGQVSERLAALAGEYEPPFLIEEYLPQRRLHALVLGHYERDVLPLVESGEIDAPGVDADEHGAGARPWVVAALDRATVAHIGELARRAYRALGCRDVACIDVHLDAAGRPHVVDVRPVVDFDPDGPLHAAAEHSERGFAGVVVELVQRAAQR